MKVRVILAAVALAGCVAAKAQENVVKLNPLGLLFGSFNVGYERVINEGQSAQLNVNIITFKVGDSKFSGFGLTPEYRFHFGNHENPKGFYAGPYINFNTFKWKVEPEEIFGVTTGGSETSVTAFGVGGIIGHQWILGEAFAIDLNLGAGYNTVSLDSDVEDDDEPSFGLAASGILPRFGLSFGYAF